MTTSYDSEYKVALRELNRAYRNLKAVHDKMVEERKVKVYAGSGWSYNQRRYQPLRKHMSQLSELVRKESIDARS